MNEIPDDLFAWADGSHIDNTPAQDNVDDLFDRCRQCDIGGGQCPSHPRHRPFLGNTTHSAGDIPDTKIADQEAEIARIEDEQTRPLSKDEMAAEIQELKKLLK